jgi:hypothetical protein
MAREPNDPSDVPNIDSLATSASMLARPTLRRPERPDQDDAPKPKGQTRPIEKRFLLKVDGQVKCSFDSGEAAKTAGTAITEGLSGRRGYGRRLPGAQVRVDPGLGPPPRCGGIIPADALLGRLLLAVSSRSKISAPPPAHSATATALDVAQDFFGLEAINR